MSNTNAKSAGYIEQALSELRKLVQEASDRQQLMTTLERFLTAKLKQSFLNGIDTQKKRQGKIRPKLKK